MDKMDNTEQERVKDLLKDIQLDQFYRQIHGKLHITRLTHFDHVTEEDLDDLGMAKPEQRRLLEALKKAKKKSLFSSFKRKKTKKAESQTEAAADRTSCYGVAGDSLTCLISEQSLTLYEMLGNGAFGYVRRGKWMKDSRKKVNVAVKCLKAWNDKAFQQMQMEFIKEANAMSLLDHPHIIRLHGIVLSVPMMLVTELAPLGCLLTRLRDEPHNFTISALSDFVVQIASGMAYLESHRFVHRDLAARNLLLESYEKVKIGDFGMMRVLSGEDDHYTMHPSGKIPFAWCPQEVLKFRKFTHASDVWAFGITVLELFSYGMEPWPGLNGAEVLDKVDMPLCERPKRPDHCPQEIYNILMLHCWPHEPHQRARFAVLKKMMDEAHPVNAAAVYPYNSKCQANLSFNAGDIVTLLDASPETSWWKGQNMRTKQVGMFPSELVESGLRRAVSPVSHWTSPKQRSSSKHSSRQCNRLPNCDCGSVHIYETPVLLDSADLFTTNSRGSTSRSSRSVESDFTSSTEVDSGYSSSVDVRRFNVLNGDSSPEQQKANFGASYENTSIGKQNTKSATDMYELMAPAFNVGPASSPIPIPKQGSGEPRYVRELHNVPLTPQLSEDKCPLDFCNLRNQNVSITQVVSPPPAPAKSSSSLPTSSAVQISPQEPRLSKTVSPPGSKKSDSGVRETFAQEMFTLLKEVNKEKSLDGSTNKPVEEDIYEDLSRPFVSVPSDLTGHRTSSTSSRDSLKACNESSYENHCFAVHGNNTLVHTSQNEHSAVNNEYDRIRCNSAHQAQSGHELRDVRCSTWPTQQNYDNHKLRDDTTAASTSRNCCYDNHKLRSLPSSDLSYDNWKIKNEVCDGDAQLTEGKKPRSCYENVEWPVAETRRQSYENCLPKSLPSSYENFTPKPLQNKSAKCEQKNVSGSLFENCEVLDIDKRKGTSEGETLSTVMSRLRDQGDSKAQELSRSLPTNCCCVDVVPGELPHESMSMIVEKRSPHSLARVRSVNAIEQKGLTGECEDRVIGGNPVPPPRWKRMARLSPTQSLVGCSQEQWAVAINPEIASVLRKRYNGAVDDTAVGAPAELYTNKDSESSKDPQIEAVDSEKPALPPRAEENGAVTTKHLNTTGNAYENVMLQGKTCTEEVSSAASGPPELPPKMKRSYGSNTFKMNNATTTRALHYENVDVVHVNGFHFESCGNVGPELENDVPPPLPRKLSQKKVRAPPTIPCRVDLEQKC